MLADIFPTGYHATEMAGVKPGDQTIVFGAGPVGLMATYSALLKGAGRVWPADHHPDRLRKAEEIGAIPINTAEQDPAEVVKEATLGLGADNGCECVGYQAHAPEGNEDASLTLNGLIDSVRFSGDIGVVGVFLPQDPGGAEAQGELEAQGKVPIDFGMMWFKGQRTGTGQAPVKKYNRALRDLIAGGKAEPSFVVSHELSLDEAPTAYEHFDARDEGWTKVVLHPNGHGTATSGKRLEAAVPPVSPGPARGTDADLPVRRTGPGAIAALRPDLDRQRPALRPGGRTADAQQCPQWQHPVQRLRPPASSRAVWEASLPDGCRTSNRPTRPGRALRLGSHP